jgi:integrase
MRWSELSTDLVTWALPGERMKNLKPHAVHLVDPARAILRQLPRVEGRDLVFTCNGRTAVSGFSKAKSALDALMCQARAASAGTLNQRPEKLANWHTHDFRRTGVSTLARLGFDSIVADKILAHQPGKLLGVAAVYQLYDFASERADALEAWWRIC